MAKRLGLREVLTVSLLFALMPLNSEPFVQASDDAAPLRNGKAYQSISRLDVTEALSNSVTAIGTGVAHTCAVTGAGGVKCWGDNSNGQLGDGTDTDRHTPVNVSGLSTGVITVTGGLGFTCALTSGGGVKCWGYDHNGQLGNGTAGSSYTPVDVVGLRSGLKRITAGGHHACALNNTGSVKCWGYNYFGQVGDGTTTNRLEPISVGGLGGGVKDIVGGYFHTCALTSAGGVKCWGYNSNGQLGDGTTTNRLTPVSVSGLSSGVRAIAAAQGYLLYGDSGQHTCALTSAGGVKCWGYNTDGQLGDGTTTNRLTPVGVTGLSSGMKAIAVGEGHTCALTSAGGVKCWGNNAYGQLGDGTTTDRLTPVNVSGLSSGVSAIAASGEHTCALTSAGGIKCWGDNQDGQLGDGTTINRHTPVDVVGFSGGRPPNSRTVGAVTVYANNFSSTTTPWTATGTVWIGNYTIVENATVTATGNTLTGSGLVHMITSADGSQLTRLFQDSFSVNVTNGALTPQFNSGMIWQLSSLVGFAFQTPPTKLTIDVLGGVTKGEVNLIFQIPGNVVPQGITFSLSHTGAVTGALVGTAQFQLGGVQLNIQQASLGTRGLLIQSAELQLPIGLGGARAALSVNDARITSDGRLTLASGAAAINFPNIHVGGASGFGIEGAQAKLSVNNGAFEFQGAGTFVLPGVGAGGSACKLGTSFTLSSTPPPVRQVSLSISGCFKIPIGTSGFFITRVSGTFAMDQATVGIDLGLGIESGLSILNHNALSGDVGAHWDNRWAVGLHGNLKVFSFDVAQAALTLSQARGLEGQIHISLVGVVDGQGQLHIWQDSSRFHMTGQAAVSVGVKKGQIVDQCLSFVCLLIPPADVTVGNASADMGEFNVNGTSVYGLKGQLSNFFGLQPAFFIDVQGDIQFDTSGLQQYQLALFGLQSLTDTITRTWTVSTNTPALMVGLAFSSGTPALTLIGPSQVITSGSPGIVMNTSVTQTVFTVPNPTPGLWQAQVANLPPSATSVLAAFGARPSATIAPPIVSPNGNGTYTIGLLGSSAAPTSTINLFYDTNPISHTGQLITTGLLLTTTSYVWQPTDVVSGTYSVYAMVDDPLGAPAYAYALMPLTITDTTAPDTPLDLSAIANGSAITVTWQPSLARDVAGYHLHSREPGGGQTFIADVPGRQSTSHVQTGFYLNGDWEITLSAYDLSGNESASSPAVVAKITANVPHASFSGYLPVILR